MKKEPLFIGAMTKVGAPSLVTKPIEILICGYEVIKTPKGTKVTQKRESASGSFSIDMNTYFVGDVDCPITEIALAKDKDGREA